MRVGRARVRWLRVGPGLALAAAASLLLWRQLPPLTEEPPRIPRTRVETTPTPPVGVPDPAWLVRQRDALKLSDQQATKLESLHARWQRETRTLRDALDHAASEFNQNMAARGGAGMTLETLRERAAPITALSRQLREARHAWWSEAATVLTPAQRRQAEQAWLHQLAPPPHQQKDGRQ